MDERIILRKFQIPLSDALVKSDILPLNAVTLPALARQGNLGRKVDEEGEIRVTPPRGGLIQSSN